MIKILSEAQVLFLHDALIKRFGGAEGVLNKSMLKSALQSGLVTFDSKDLFPTDLEKIVRISYGLITNHAFRDGNKRVGISALILMLEENDINIKIPHKDLIGIGYAVGSGTMDYAKMLDKIRKRLQEKLILDESLFEEYNNKIIYKSISNIDKFKKYADEILGGYGGMSDSDIKRDIQEIYIDGELKGYLGLSEYQEDDGTKLLGIGNFMILERGKGYGTQVINDLVSKYKNEYDLIYCFVDSDNEGAISLYKKLGKVYDEDGPNDNGQYYVTFYDNGKYKLEESYTKNSMFFLSDKNMDGKTLEPRVPNNFLIKNGYEDSKSKRVCFAPSIDKALMAISQNLKGKKFFVHTPVDVDEKYVHQPSVKEVPDVKITGEVWYTTPVKLKTIGQIEVIEDDGLPGHTYTYGKDNSAELYGWNWEWVDRKELDESLTSVDDIETPEQLMAWMEENITYELANDEYGAEDDPPTKTAEEVIETGTGHCAEQSYLEYKVLDELGYFPQLIFVKENNSEDDYGADGSAHMFVVYQNDDDKYTYFEHNQEHNKGIHKFDSMDELLDFVGKNWWRYDANSDILEVRYIDEPITGVNNWELAQECHEYLVDEVLDISNNVMEEDMISESLTEAKKKRKNKKVSQVNPGEAIFKSVKDMKKWVKKRQKGMSPFCYLNPNAGNVPLSNNIFNSMFSSDSSSGVGTSEGGLSNGGLSVGNGDTGGGMGEGFNPDLKLKLHYTKSLSDYLTSTEQEFIRNNMDLIDSERWLELKDKVDNTFDYPLTTRAIFKFLADGLGYDFTYFEELLKLK